MNFQVTDPEVRLGATAGEEGAKVAEGGHLWSFFLSNTLARHFSLDGSSGLPIPGAAYWHFFSMLHSIP